MAVSTGYFYQICIAAGMTINTFACRLSELNPSNLKRSYSNSPGVIANEPSFDAGTAGSRVQFTTAGRTNQNCRMRSQGRLIESGSSRAPKAYRGIPDEARCPARLGTRRPKPSGMDFGYTTKGKIADRYEESVGMVDRGRRSRYSFENIDNQPSPPKRNAADNDE